VAEPEYLEAIGKAVYVFARVEWNIIWIVAKLKPDYFNETRSPDQKLTSTITKDLWAALAAATSLDTAMRARITSAVREFERLTKRRNHLVHAHPFTDAEGKQRLGKTEERHWSMEKIRTLIAELEASDRETGGLVHSLP
jgi:hypothetical protein